MHRRITQATTVIMMLALIITGCTSQASNIGMAKDKANKAVDTGFRVSTVGSYDSADTAVVVGVDPSNNAVTLMNMGADRQYTLYYDGTTYVQDKYGGPMTISQIQTGDVVNVNFLKGKRQIASIQLSPEAWIYDNVTNYDLGGINKTASIGSTTYSLPDNVVVFSEGKRAEVMDIVNQDVISVHGVDHNIYSIKVNRGHGYLRLKNDQALIGGWIEVGNAVIREISEDMLLVVPEGSYQVLLSNEGVSATKDVVIERNKEVVLDVSDLEIARDKTGRILFSVTPANAEVKIDGKDVNISSAVELSYGIHQVHLEAEGYDSLTKYIQVGSEYAKISFTLEEKKEPVEEDSPISGNNLETEKTLEPEELEERELETTERVKEPSVSENTITPSSSNKVYIDYPEGVEVYVDGNYIGISPISFKKTVGSHTVTLRKSGYVTKSYTIYLYNDGEDITYSFSDLEKYSTVSSSGTGSSNSTTDKGDTVSGNQSSTSSSSTSTSSSQSSETNDPDTDNGDNEESDGSDSEEKKDESENEEDKPGDEEDEPEDEEDEPGDEEDEPEDEEDEVGDEEDGLEDEEDEENNLEVNVLYYGKQIGKQVISGQIR